MNLLRAFRLFMQDTDELTLALRMVSEPQQYFGPGETAASPAQPPRTSQAPSGTVAISAPEAPAAWPDAFRHSPAGSA